MMLVVLIQRCRRGEIARLCVRQLITKNHRDRLSLSYVLPQFRTNATHNPANERHHWNFAVGIRLNNARCLLAGCLGRDTLAYRLDLDARTLELFGSDSERGFSRRINSVSSALI